MVGDPNQAIYGFNGSSSRYMCENFPKEYGAQEYRLVENFRSSKAVIEAAKIIEPSFEMKGQLPIKGVFEIYPFEDEQSEAVWIAQKIAEMLKNGHPDIEDEAVSPQKCAVIARNRYIFNSLTAVFDEQKVDYNLRISSNNGLMSESIFFKLLHPLKA